MSIILYIVITFSITQHDTTRVCNKTRFLLTKPKFRLYRFDSTDVRKLVAERKVEQHEAKVKVTKIPIGNDFKARSINRWAVYSTTMFS